MNRRGFFGLFATVPLAAVKPVARDPHEQTLREALQIPRESMAGGWHEYGVGFDFDWMPTYDNDKFQRFMRYLHFTAARVADTKRLTQIRHGRVFMRFEAR